jgi:plastocyanin
VLAYAAVAVAVLPATASAKSKIVYPGGPVGFQNKLANRTGGGVDNFMINKVTINVGDTVVWNGKARANGFHTIDLPGRAKTPLPLIVAFGAHPVAGVNDAAGNPFWFNGLPSLGFNPLLLKPSGRLTYNGTQRIDSGLPLGRPHDLKVTFTKPGTYRYFCDVHPGMQGFVVVLPKGKNVPTAAQDRAELAKEEKADTATAKKLDKTTVNGNNVHAGAAGKNGVEIFAFFPNTLHVPVGAVVRFSMARGSREAHTVTFGDTSKTGYVTMLGQTAFNQPVFDPRGAYPSDPPPGPPSLSAASHGNGFVNTGPMDTVPATPTPSSSAVKFTQAGTYHFICLIHPFMHGTVVVS